MLTRRVLTVTVSVLLMVAASCGNAKPKESADSDRSSSPATNSGSDEKVPNDSPGVTDTSIRVGGVASVTNPLGGKYGDAFEGVKAYFDMVNDEGGIYGRQLELVAERDDKVANNKTEVEGLLSQDNVFAVLPVATLLFGGATTLVEQKVPTFGWTINPDWQGSADDPRLNLFGQTGSFLCFGCDNLTVPWIAQETNASKIGVLSYQVAQSSECAEGVKLSFEKYGDAVGAAVAFDDLSLTYGTTDFSVQVGKMKDAGVDLVTTCMDTNGVVALAKEMKKQGLDAPQYLPNAYDHEFVEEFGDLFEGSFVRTDFVQWEVPEDDQPEGLRRYLEWIGERDVEPSENSAAGWLNAALFVDGLREAGPNFTRQSVIDGINKLTNWNAEGMIHGVDWTASHTSRLDENEGCQFLSRIEDSAFVPAYTKPGKPFVCSVWEDGKVTTRFDAGLDQ